MSIAVVIPNFNGAEVLPRCLRALAAQTVAPAEVIVVDNGSHDGSADDVERDYPGARVLRLPRNHGFAGGSNRGVLASTAPRVAVLNSDARPAPDWIERLLAAPDDADIWCWGSVLVSTEGRVESAADHWSDEGFAYKLARGADPGALPGVPFDAFAATGAAPLFRREAFAALGGYEERFFLYYEDIDLAYRALLRGWRAVVVPHAHVEHDLGASGTRSRTRFYVARNALWCAVSCIPEASWRAVAARVVHELAHNRPRRLVWAEIAGRAAALAGLPWALRRRRRLQSARALTPEEVRARLELPPALAPLV